MSRQRNAADADSVKSHEERDDLLRRRDLDDFRKILDTPHGRRFWLKMVDRTGVFKVSFDNSGSITARNEGMRLIGLHLWAELEQIDGLAFHAQALQEAHRDQLFS
jgi:hypothetical protein